MVGRVARCLLVVCVEGGPPMMLIASVPTFRRALVLVLHDADKPWMTVTTEWRPTVNCPEK